MDLKIGRQCLGWLMEDSSRAGAEFAKRWIKSRAVGAVRGSPNIVVNVDFSIKKSNMDSEVTVE